MAGRHERDRKFEFTAGSTASEASGGHEPALGTPSSNGDGAQEHDSEIDLTLVQADDALLDALAGYDVEAGDDERADIADQELNALLLAWRRDVDSVAIGEVVDTETAVATVAAARAPKRRRPRFLVPVSTAAAVLVIAFGGASIMARDAQPGDALWGLTRVLYADHARSVEAAASVRNELQDAKAALGAGRLEEARSALEAASSALAAVASEDGQDDLRMQHQMLSAQLGTDAPQPPQNPPVSPAPTVSMMPPVATSSVPSSRPSSIPSEPSSPPSSSPESSSPPTTSSTPSSAGGESSSGGGGGSVPRGETPAGGQTQQDDTLNDTPAN